jgi:hypothetical protein
MTPTAGPLDPYDPDTVGRRHGGPDVWGQSHPSVAMQAPLEAVLASDTVVVLTIHATGCKVWITR